MADLRGLAGKGKWRLHAGGPVLRPGKQGEWDSWTLATMNVLQAGELFHMYYEGGSKGVVDFQIGHASSVDGIHWVKDAANPVIPVGRTGQWDDAETWDPFVLHEDGLFKMWYGGTTLIGDDRDFQVGYAISRDGTRFVERRRISQFANSRGLGNVGDMHVVHHEGSGRYYMYFLDRNERPYALFRAESKNETDFEFEHSRRITMAGETGGYRCPHVICMGDHWHMLYGFKHENRAGYAISTDGLNWESRNQEMIDGHDPEILPIEKNLYLLFYTPSQYHMGHEPGSDIRLAVLEGELNCIASGRRS